MNLRYLKTTCVALLVAAGLLLGLPASGARAQSFADVQPGAWFYDAVEALATQGAVAGYPDGTFRPYNPITRAQFAAMAFALLDLPPGDGTGFADVSTKDWFAGALGALRDAGVVQGGADGLFLPNADIARQQAASVAMRALAVRVRNTPGPPSEPADLSLEPAEVEAWLSGFSDRWAVGEAHRPAVADAYRLGVLSGHQDGRFYPWLSLTRAQAAGILYAALVRPLTVRPALPEAVPSENSYPTAGQGSRGPLVDWLERKLVALTYLPGSVDGVYDARTAEAVMAFQKVLGLERTDAAGMAVWTRLGAAERPAPRKNGGGVRVEIDLSKQVLMVVRDGAVTNTVAVATGREGWRTPTGTFSVYRKLPYWRESRLGMLYKPCYFVGGYAIHGSTSVPAYPASHGCVRVSVATMDHLYPQLTYGIRVDIFY